uniref:Uncharacterized protein n=1 Tax=Corethron hystrix TaxID=216773 RepID=A0A7S1C2A1_9STRA
MAALRIQHYYRARTGIAAMVKKAMALKKIQTFARRCLKRNRFKSLIRVVVDKAQKDKEIDSLVDKLQTSLSHTDNKHVSETQMLPCVASEEEIKVLTYAKKEMKTLRRKNVSLEAENSLMAEEHEKLAQTLLLEKAKSASLAREIKHMLSHASRKSKEWTAARSRAQAHWARSSKAILLQADIEARRAAAIPSHEKELQRMREELEVALQYNERRLRKAKGRWGAAEARMRGEIDGLKREIEEDGRAYADSLHDVVTALDLEVGGEKRDRDGP